MLATMKLKDTIDFYVKILGFTCESYTEEWGWASLKRNEVRLMVAKPNESRPFNEPSFTGSFYFMVDDVDEWWESLRGKANVCYPVENFDYGMREFAIYDNNGYILQFGQEWP